MSVGKGTEEKSILAIRKARNTGLWICLKNIHLIPNWLYDLEIELQTTATASTNVNENFRIFLTCETVKGFPESFMSKCNKILYEAPSGIKNKIQRQLQQWNKMLSEKRDPKVVKLYIILFILNSVLQERRLFIPQGILYYYFYFLDIIIFLISIFNTYM